jgi:hypothetical protein
LDHARSFDPHTLLPYFSLRLPHFSSLSRLYNRVSISFWIHIAPHSLHSKFTASDIATNQHSLSFMYIFFFSMHLSLAKFTTSSIHIAPPSQCIRITSLPACPVSSPSRPLLAAHNPSSPSLLFYSPATRHFDFDSHCKNIFFLAHRSRYHALPSRLLLRIHIVILVNVTMAPLSFLVSPCRFAYLTHLRWNCGSNLRDMYYVTTVTCKQCQKLKKICNGQRLGSQHRA